MQGKKMMRLQEVKLAVVGLGYVGLPLAVELGKRRQGLGFDVDARRIEDLREGRDRTLGVERDELKSAAQLRWAAEAEAEAEANVCVVTGPTPIDEYKQAGSTP